MKILHCIPTLECGGAERQLSYLAPELARRGHEVHVAFLRGGINLGRLQQSPVHLHQLKARSNYDPFIFWQLIKLVRKINPDIMQTWILQMDILAGLAAKVVGVPWVLREPNSAKSWFSGIKNILRWWLGKRAHTVIANSSGGEAYWRSQGLSGQVYLIPNSLPVEEIAAEPVASLTGIGKNDPEKVILYVGRLFDKQKNVERFIQALIALNKNLKIKAALCGDGPDRMKFAELINRHGMKDRIFLPGVVNNVWGLMKGADVFVSVSHYEGRPNTVLEAMACGCPLVVSDIPAHREFLDESSAVFVDPLDVEAIAQSIHMVLENPQAARSRAEVARAKVAAWTIPAIAGQYEEVYWKVLRLKMEKSGKVSQLLVARLK